MGAEEEMMTNEFMKALDATRLIKGIDPAMPDKEIKIDPMYYEFVISGAKQFEVRKEDRDYRVGDYVLMREYDWLCNEYTGRYARVIIKYIQRSYLQKGYCSWGFDLFGFGWEGKAETAV